VGWVTDTGQFVDVTAAVTGSGGAFSGKVLHQGPAFGPDGAFYYADTVAKKVMKVTTATPATAADATPVADAVQ
jgi:sugar lactone lactonase YvrE